MLESADELVTLKSGPSQQFAKFFAERLPTEGVRQKWADTAGRRCSKAATLSMRFPLQKKELGCMPEAILRCGRAGGWDLGEL